jgi:hypothetical protein
MVSHAYRPVELQASSLPGGDLDSRRRMLENRLDDGFHRIDQAVLSGTDVTEWESYWLRLLGEYHDVCRELDQAA